MTINLTLIIQMIHFFIAYYIIDKFLLKKAINIIKNEENIENTLITFIKNEEIILEKKELEKKIFLEKTLQEVELMKPNLEEIPKIHINWRIIKPTEMSPEYILNLKNKISEFIINQVNNVK